MTMCVNNSRASAPITATLKAPSRRSPLAIKCVNCITPNSLTTKVYTVDFMEAMRRCESWLCKIEQGDKWSFRLTAAMMACEQERR